MPRTIGDEDNFSLTVNGQLLRSSKIYRDIMPFWNANYLFLLSLNYPGSRYYIRNKDTNVIIRHQSA